MEIDSDYRKLLEPDELTAYEDDWFTVRNDSLRDFKSTTEMWLQRKTMEIQSKELTFVEELKQETASVHSKNARSSRSSHHTHTSLLSAKIKEEERLAVPEIRGEALKKKRQLEQEKLDLRMREEEQKLDTW